MSNTLQTLDRATLEGNLAYQTELAGIEAAARLVPKEDFPEILPGTTPTPKADLQSRAAERGMVGVASPTEMLPIVPPDKVTTRVLDASRLEEIRKPTTEATDIESRKIDPKVNEILGAVGLGPYVGDHRARRYQPRHRRDRK